jgi:hypothetical protein
MNDIIAGIVLMALGVVWGATHATGMGNRMSIPAVLIFLGGGFLLYNGARGYPSYVPYKPWVDRLADLLPF